MKAQIKYSHYLGHETEDVSSFRPENDECFCAYLRLFIGPQDEQGEESYDVQIITPRWLQECQSDFALVGKNKLIVAHFDHAKIIDFLTRYVERATGANWQEISRKLHGLGSWEFDDYS